MPLAPLDIGPKQDTHELRGGSGFSPWCLPGGRMSRSRRGAFFGSWGVFLVEAPGVQGPADSLSPLQQKAQPAAASEQRCSLGAPGLGERVRHVGPWPVLSSVSAWAEWPGGTADTGSSWSPSAGPGGGWRAGSGKEEPRLDPGVFPTAGSTHMPPLVLSSLKCAPPTFVPHFPSLQVSCICGGGGADKALFVKSFKVSRGSHLPGAKCLKRSHKETL